MVVVGGLGRSAFGAASTAVAALTVVVLLLAYALVTKDFRFQYVTEYSDPLLPWHYSLSALWVGQAGSLLVWSWFVAVLAIIFRFTSSPRPWGEGQGVRASFAGNSLSDSHIPSPQPSPGTMYSWSGRGELLDLAFGAQMAYLAFLLAIMIFAADPMAPALTPGAKGDGLSPLLQHPAMLIHPPIVFLGYAAWGIPFSLAAAALLSGQLDNAWLQQARPWSLFAWTTLGGGIFLGAEWAYEQLGWGGYWAWDPVENGSLMPWLTGTALIHGLMTWRQGAFKKTTLFLAIATFGLCNFATFLTRSGIFSSLHAFSQSPIGWMFLLWIAAFVVGGTLLIVRRRSQLRAEKPLAALWSREALVLLGIVALVLLTSVTLLGTLAGAISGLFSATPIMVGLAFYNNVLIPTGLVLLAVVAAVPLLRWGAGPTAPRARLLAVAAAGGLLVALAALLCGVRNPIGLAVACLAGTLLASTFLAIATDGIASRRSVMQYDFGLRPASPQLRGVPHPSRFRLHGDRNCRLRAGKPRDRSLHDPRPERGVRRPHDPLRRVVPARSPPEGRRRRPTRSHGADGNELYASARSGSVSPAEPMGHEGRHPFHLRRRPVRHPAWRQRGQQDPPDLDRSPLDPLALGGRMDGAGGRRDYPVAGTVGSRVAAAARVRRRPRLGPGRDSPPAPGGLYPTRSP